MLIRDRFYLRCTANPSISYKKAYDSLKACPLTFNHPSEAQQLHGLGPKLCARLADKLKKHCEANGLPMPTVRRCASKRHCLYEEC